MSDALKYTRPPAHSAARNLGAMSDRLGLPAAGASSAATRAASWPTGVSLLAQMIDACQRCEAAGVCDDWLARAPRSIAVAPAFCVNADALMKAKR